MQHLRLYSWPGNVRELGNLIERLIILHTDQAVFASDLPAKYQSADLAIAERPEGVQPLVDQLPDEEPKISRRCLHPRQHRRLRRPHRLISMSQ